MDSSTSSIQNPPQKIPFLKRLTHSYKTDWKPLLAAKVDLDEEYTFASGPRRGANLVSEERHGETH
jgi:hypothetical protein